MRAPDFWRRRTVTPFVLLPLAAAYSLAGRLRWAATRPWKADIPVICAGNLVAGGAGKTPLAMALAGWFAAKGRKAHFLTRGYRGRERGPVRVDLSRHGFGDVGDEALLLAGVAPTWVARDRPAGARAAMDAGAEIIIMDDGFQNPGLHKDLSLIAIDGGYGFGNGLVLPAGPLRETLPRGFARADAAVIIGRDREEAASKIPAGFPILQARLAPGPEAEALAGRKLVAFAGIGRPEKFFDSLRGLGCELLDAVPFPDHHVYKPDEVMWLVEMAAASGAKPVTTLKDYVRLPEEAKPMVETLSVTLEWADEAALDALLSVF